MKISNFIDNNTIIYDYLSFIEYMQINYHYLWYHGKCYLIDYIDEKTQTIGFL